VGTDIHISAEKRVDGRWIEIGRELMYYRIYSVFGWLADVCNASAVPPLSERRGLPDDLAERLREYHDDNHSPTWYMASELVSFDFDPVEDRRKRGKLPDGSISGMITCPPGEGEMTTYRALFGPFSWMGSTISRPLAAERIVISFDG